MSYALLDRDGWPGVWLRLEGAMLGRWYLHALEVTAGGSWRDPFVRLEHPQQCECSGRPRRLFVAVVLPRRGTVELHWSESDGEPSWLRTVRLWRPGTWRSLYAAWNGEAP